MGSGVFLEGIMGFQAPSPPPPCFWMWCVSAFALQWAPAQEARGRIRHGLRRLHNWDPKWAFSFNKLAALGILLCDRRQTNKTKHARDTWWLNERQSFSFAECWAYSSQKYNVIIMPLVFPKFLLLGSFHVSSTPRWSANIASALFHECNCTGCFK